MLPQVVFLFYPWLFAIGGIAVQGGDIHQLHAADVMVVAQGIHQNAGGIQRRDARDGQLGCLAAELDGIAVRVTAMGLVEMM